MRYRTWKKGNLWVVEKSYGLFFPWELISSYYQDSFFGSLEEAEKAIARRKYDEKESRKHRKKAEQVKRWTMRYY